MNEPIISPWLIYWITRLDLLHFSLKFIITAITVGMPALLLIIVMVGKSDAKIENNCKLCIKYCVSLLLFTAFLHIFLPSKEVVIAMYAAKQITPANIQSAGKIANDSIDYIENKQTKLLMWL